MTTIRRSERLADTTSAFEKKILTEITKKITDIAHLLKKCTSPFEKIDIVIKVLKICNNNFSILLYSSNDRKFLQILYNNSFPWIKQVNDIADKDLTEKLVKEYAKYRKKYEKFRYANWEFIRDKYGMDANLMNKIDSYM